MIPNYLSGDSGLKCEYQSKACCLHAMKSIDWKKGEETQSNRREKGLEFNNQWIERASTFGPKFLIGY